MVRLILGGLVLISATGHAADLSSAKKDVDIDSGRYRLFQGSYPTFDLRRSETYSSTSVFLIDTKTGQVKRYVNKIDTDGRYIEEWVSTDRKHEKK